jgi:predicted negative regulator of RcsB-dependent stress response
MNARDRVIITLHRLARIQLAKGKWDEAMQSMFKARELRSKKWEIPTAADFKGLWDGQEGEI